MIVLGEINNREVLYVKHDLATNWFKDFPKSNWLLFAITDRWLPEIFEEISRRAVDNDVVYVCSTGDQADTFHHKIDDMLVIRDVENEYLHFIQNFLNGDLHVFEIFQNRVRESSNMCG